MSSAKEYDVVVIGAGIEGSASAYSLIKNGQKTLLLEQFPLPHTRGSSHGQSRITRYAYSQEFYVRMMLDAYPLWDTLSQEVETPLFKECGVLAVGTVNGKFLSSMSQTLTRLGKPFQPLTPSELRHRFPMLTYQANYGGIVDPRGGILRADKALQAYQAIFKKLGGVLQDGEQVRELIPRNSEVIIRTSKGEYRAKKIVIAAGAWTSKLIRPLGLTLPLRPIRITVCYWKEKSEGALSSERFPCLIDDGENDERVEAFALPSDEYPGYFKLCLHTGPDADPDNRDHVDDLWVRETITAYARRHFPGLEGNPAIMEHCIYTKTPDLNPVIDSHPKWQNVIVAAGFSGHGFKLAPAVGKAVTELVLNKPQSYNMAAFKISRFAHPANL